MNEAIEKPVEKQYLKLKTGESLYEIEKATGGIRKCNERLERVHNLQGKGCYSFVPVDGFVYVEGLNATNAAFRLQSRIEKMKARV